MDFVVAECNVRSFGDADRRRRGNVFGLYQHFDVITINQRYWEMRHSTNSLLT